jgi:hypothetical protein
MYDIKMEILGSPEYGVKATIKSFAPETILNISPVNPNQPLDENVVPFDKLEFDPEHGMQIPDDWGGMRRPRHEFLGSNETYERDIAAYNAHRKKFAAETRFDYFVRTANPHAKSIITIFHKTDDEYSETSYVTSQSIQDITARYPNLKPVITEEVPLSIRKPKTSPHPDSPRGRMIDLRAKADLERRGIRL